MARLDAALRRVALDDAELAAGCLLTGAVGAASCPFLVPAAAIAGHRVGELANKGIDAAEPALKSIGHAVSHGVHSLERTFAGDPRPILWDGNISPGQLVAPGGGTVG